MSRSLQIWHELPLWMPSFYSGFPIAPGNTFGALQPLSLLLLFLFNPIPAYHTATILAILAALYATYAFARRLALSCQASIIAAFTYGFSQFTIFWSHGNPWSQSFFFPPLLFYLLVKIGERKNVFWYTGLGAITLAVALYSSLIDIVAYALLAALALALWLDFRSNSSMLPRWLFHVTKHLVILTLVGGILAAPLIIPTLRLTAYSKRATGFSFFQSGGNAGLTWRELPLLIYPDFITDIPRFNVNNPWVYMGTFSLVFGLWGLIRHKRATPYGRFLFLLFIAVLVLMVPYSPLYWLIQHLPPFNTLHGGWKSFPILNLIFALFAGIGFDRLLHDCKESSFRAYVKVWQWLGGSILMLAILFNLFWHSPLRKIFKGYFISQVLMPRHTSMKPELYYHEMFDNFAKKIGDNLSFINSRFLLALGILFSAVVILTLWKKRIQSQRLLVVTFALTIMNFPIIWQNSERFFPTDILRFPTTMQAIATGTGEPGRVMFAVPSMESVADHRLPYDQQYAYIRTDYALGMRLSGELFGIESMSGDDVFAPKRYQKILETLGPADIFSGPPGFDNLSLDDKARYTAAQTHIFSMANVRYLITPFILPAPWKLIANTEEGTMPLAVYENSRVLPRAYFPMRVTMVKPDEEKNFALLLQNKDFRENAFIECPNEGECPVSGQTVTPHTATARLLQGSPRRFAVETETSENRWLVVSNNNVPYWQVRINGRPATLYTANYVYQGIFIPAGHHRVEFEYVGILKQMQYALKDLLANSPPYAPYTVK